MVICKYVKFPFIEKTNAGTAINVATLVFVAIKDNETAHQGKFCPPLKKASNPLSLFLTNSPTTVVPNKKTIRIIQFNVLKLAEATSVAANKLVLTKIIARVTIFFFICLCCY